MVKKLLLLFNYLLFVAVIQAAPVGRSDAQKKAQQFVAGKLAAARGTSLTQADLSLVKEEGSCYYIFNVGSRDGFVIVSGDDRAPEILGYSDTGSFDENNMPDNMKAWLQGYADQIQLLSDMPEVAESRAEQPKRTTEKSAVSPLIQTTWDQGAPYNQKVPNFVNGAPSVTGCVATAMAQVLYYTAMHSSGFPAATTIVIPAYQCGRGWNMGDSSDPHHVQVPEVPVTTFQWNNMLLDYSTGATVDQKNAVADLMLCCGASVEMDYASEANSGSQASDSKIPYAFQTYFGFDGHVRHIKRSDYTIDEWENIIYGEIHNNRPVIYSGQTSANTGHSFVCDGYDSNGLFHFNWGWGGNCDGYFVLWSANPHGGGIGASNGYDGYSMTQDAVIGIQKPTGTPIAEETKCLTVNDIKVYNNVLEYTRTSSSQNFVVPICAVVTNATGTTFNVELGIGLYNGNTFDSFLLQNNTYSYASGGSCPSGTFYGISNNQYEFNDYFFGANKTGTYQIIPISREAGTDPWLKDRLNDQYYIEATMTETQLTLSVKPIVNLAVTNVVYTGLKMAGLVQEVKVSVRNDGSDYNGNLYLLVNDSYVSGEGVALKSGQTTDMFFHYVPSAGENNYKVSLSSNGTNPLATGTQEISAYNATDNIDLTMSVNIHNDIVGSNVLGNQLVATVTATNNSDQVYQGTEIGLMYQYTLGNGYYNAWTNMSNVRLLPGESISGVLSFDIAQGLTYTINAYQTKNSSRVTKETTYQYTAAVTSLNLHNVTSVTDISVLNAPNCLFLVDNESTLSGKNVIKGTNAAQVELTDGADFTAPVNFTATEISYSRDITQGTDGENGGWTTIVLPFDVDKVYAVDGSSQTEIDWFHSNTDTGKNFWLRRFVSDGVGTVSFDYTDKIDANTPYIIAVPGSHWGAEFDLTGKTLKFVGSNKNIKMNATAEKSGTNYDFVGTTTRQSLGNVYALNDSGSSFVLSTNPVPISPFRAYFTSKSLSAARLMISSADEQPTIIAMPEKEPLLSGDIYTLDGRKVKAISQKGVYIINGKKVIK